MAADSTGAYVVGATDGSLPGQSNAGLSDAYIRKYDPSGTVLWTEQFGTSEDDYASQVAADSTGAYVVGHTYGSLPDQTNAGLADAFIRKYAPSGTELWTRQFGTPVNDYGFGMASGFTGLYLVGMTEGSLGGPNAGSSDAFVLRLR